MHSYLDLIVYRRREADIIELAEQRASSESRS